MNRQAANLVRQWSAVHRCQRTRKAVPVVVAVAHPSNVIESAPSAVVAKIVRTEGSVARVLLSTSLFLQRATWFAVFIVSFSARLNALTAADQAVFAPPAAADVRTKALQWAAERGVTDKNVLEQIGREWVLDGNSLTAEEVLQRVIRTLSLGDAEARKIVDACREATPVATWPQDVVPTTDSMPDFARHHLRLFVGRFLAQRQLYEEALDVLVAVDPKQVVDPASYFFQRAICEHQLLKKGDAMKSLGHLLDDTQNVPERYKAVATLMRHDLDKLREASLGEVAKKMSDVERRLILGRGGEKTQKVEEEIVEALDEIIKKAEQQQQSSSSGGGQGGNQNQSGNPANDSSVKGATAPGEVDKKDIGNKAGWGSLTPKKAAEAKNVINRNFPSHYREAIEQYFKKLANRPAGKE